MHALLFALALLAGPFVPVHGTVLAAGPNGTMIVRNDPVTEMFPARTRAYALSPRMKLAPGTGIDGMLTPTQPNRWLDAHVAARFVAGLPQQGDVFPIDYGSSLPTTHLVDQDGRIVDLARDLRGKVGIISFIFTRCPDRNECPLVSSKFTWLEQHLDPTRFHLVEISLDPSYDSPAVLHAYAKQYGAHASAWSLLTGEPSEIQHLLNRFGISSLRVSDANFIHNDKVFLSDRKGKIADIVQTLSFAPQSMQAQAEHLAGMTSNPWGRFQLALVASAVAICGGSQFAGIVMLETALFLIIAIISFFTLGFLARRIFWPKT